MVLDFNLQVLGVVYIQYKCYSDVVVKKQVCSFQVVFRLVKFFNYVNQEVQCYVIGVMCNFIYDNVDNKLVLVEENGIFELLWILWEQDDEFCKNVIGILWNFLFSDQLKDCLVRDMLEQFIDLVLSFLFGVGGFFFFIQQNVFEVEIFYNVIGFFRNFSLVFQVICQKMWECYGLVDVLVIYINYVLDVGKCEDKSVENVVCVL